MLSTREFIIYCMVELTLKINWCLHWQAKATIIHSWYHFSFWYVHAYEQHTHTHRLHPIPTHLYGICVHWDYHIIITTLVLYMFYYTIYTYIPFDIRNGIQYVRCTMFVRSKEITNSLNVCCAAVESFISAWKQNQERHTHTHILFYIKIPKHPTKPTRYFITTFTSTN